MYLSKCAYSGFKTVLRIILVAVVLLASTSLAVGAGTACSKKAKSFSILMDSAPEGTDSFTYWAVEELNDDEDLREIYSRFRESSDAEQLRELVQVLAIVKDSARISSSDNTGVLKEPVTVLRADLDRQWVEDRLNALGYSRSEYGDADIWIAGEGQVYRPVALLSGTILIGNVSDLKVCINTRKHNDQSLRDDPHIEVLTSRLPKGLVVHIERAAASSVSYVDLVAYGKSYSKIKKTLMKMTAVYVFSDGPSAEDALQQIKDNLKVAVQEVKASRDGNLVVATAQISITNFAQSLEF